MAKFFIIDDYGVITKTQNEALANKCAGDSDKYVIDAETDEEIFFNEELELSREKIEDEEGAL